MSRVGMGEGGVGEGRPGGGHAGDGHAGDGHIGDGQLGDGQVGDGRGGGRVREGRVAVITGASSGIGRCTAVLFARRGWRVGLIARGRAGLTSVQAEIAGGGGACMYVVADVRDDAALDAAAGSIEAALGPIAVWVNCAGNGVYGRFVDVPACEFDCVTDVTYRGTVNGTRAALRRMLKRNAGTVVNVCSAIAYHGLPLLTSYSGAKSAVRGFTDGVRAELACEASRVHVTIVFPPAVNTPFFSHAATHMARPPRPAKPVYAPEVVAAGILRAACGRQREVRIGAITTLFELGTKLVPFLVDRAIGRLGYAGQETDSTEALLLRDPNLFAASDKVFGSAGVFGAEARGVPVLDWLMRGRVLVGAGAVLCLALAMAVLR